MINLKKSLKSKLKDNCILCNGMAGNGKFMLKKEYIKSIPSDFRTMEDNVLERLLDTSGHDLVTVKKN